MPSSRPVDRLRDVIDNCEAILEYTQGMSLQTYSGDRKTKDAVERCLSRISEAAYKLGDYLDATYSDVDWKGARGIGNLLRHQYDKIGDSDIWDAVCHDIPLLLKSALVEVIRLEGS